MDTDFLLKLAATIVTASIGWWAVHFLSSFREKRQKRRDICTKYLIDAFERLSRSQERQISQMWQPERILDYHEDMEIAVATVQLFGTSEQVSLIRRFADEMCESGAASNDKILCSLRDDLRKELGLNAVQGPITWIRFPRHRREDVDEDKFKSTLIEYLEKHYLPDELRALPVIDRDLDSPLNDNSEIG